MKTTLHGLGGGCMVQLPVGALMPRLESCQQELAIYKDDYAKMSKLVADLMNGKRVLFDALEAIVKLTDGSQPIDYPGALIVARYAIAKTSRLEQHPLILAAPDLLAEIEQEYTELADIHNNWPGRETPQGQAKLWRLNGLICKATGRDAQDVQDDYCNRAFLAKARGESVTPAAPPLQSRLPDAKLAADAKLAELGRWVLWVLEEYEEWDVAIMDEIVWFAFENGLAYEDGSFRSCEMPPLKSTEEAP